MKWQREQFVLDTDRVRLNMTTIHGWLTETYWARGRTLDLVRRAWDASHVVFGLYDGPELIGCARVVTDFVGIAYLSDVFLLDAYRGRGLGRWMVETIVAYPALHGIRWLLHTRDAHGLYRQSGFGPVGENVMERPRPA